MKTPAHSWKFILAGGGIVLCMGLSYAGPFHRRAAPPCQPPAHPTYRGGEMVYAEGEFCGEWAGSWYWLRSPEQEQTMMFDIYRKQCARCHDESGRGVWDIPNVPDFTNERWQSSRTDAQLARLILEGRGAVMPAYRGTLTLEQAWAMARYLKTRFKPGAQIPRPDFGEPVKSEQPPPVPVPENLETAPTPQLPRLTPPTVAPDRDGRFQLLPGNP